MHILAVDHLGEDREAMGQALAQALGITLYEARTRIAGAGAGPVIIASFGNERDADKRAEQLRAAGINPLVLSQDEIETDKKRIIARTFFLADNELVVGTRTGEEVRMAYTGITVIIRGTRITHTSKTETEKKTKFDPGAAILSGGLKMTKSVTVTSTTSTDFARWLSAYLWRHTSADRFSRIRRTLRFPRPGAPAHEDGELHPPAWATETTLPRGIIRRPSLKQTRSVPPAGTALYPRGAPGYRDIRSRPFP